MNTSSNLSAEFPQRNPEDWEAAVTRSGASPGNLSSLSDDGIPVGPLYPRRRDAEPVPSPRAGRKWAVMQRVDGGRVEALLDCARDELGGGADGLVLAFAGTPHPLAGRIPVSLTPALTTALLPLLASGSRLFIEAGADIEAAASALLPSIAGRGLVLDLGFDPLAALAVGQRAAGTVGENASTVSRMVARFDDHGIDGHVALADGRIWHAAGASEVQELAAVIATYVALLRLLDDRGVIPARAAPRIGTALAADNDQFLTIAKFRALRLLLARILAEAGLTGTVPIHAETAWRMMSRREPRMNVLRTTGATFAAAVGGADSITVLPFDALDGASSAAARRLARNTQSIIADEAQVFRFADPAAGSGAVESLTDSLAEQAWDRFRAIEANGGMVAAIESGAFPGEVATMRDARLARFASGDLEMIGANVFVAKGAEPIAPAPARPENSGGDGLVFRRLTETVEATT